MYQRNQATNRLALALTACAVGTSALTGCSGASDSGTDSLPTATASYSSLSPGGSSSGVTAPASSPTVLKLNKSGSAPDLGHSWTVTEVVRNFPVPARMFSSQGKELILVKIKVTAGSKYYMSLTDSSFGLITDGDVKASGLGSTLAPEMAAAGYAPILPQASSGKTTQGWLVFQVYEPGSAKVTLRYRQAPMQVLNGKGTIAEKNIDVPLVG